VLEVPFLWLDIRLGKFFKIGVFNNNMKYSGFTSFVFLVSHVSYYLANTSVTMVIVVSMVICGYCSYTNTIHPQTHYAYAHI
jgi:hypothetical protein